MRELECDVLVLGSGAGGLSAAVAAASCAAHESKSGAMANMRSRVKRAEGPATLMVPIGN